MPTFAFASAVGSPLISKPPLLLLDATATPASQYGNPASAPLPSLLLLLLLLASTGDTTRFTSRPNFTANS
jgi:hypothetical protein